jgi:hypothetical protein
MLQLLEGHHKRFDGRKASLLHHTSLPIIDEAISAMTQEEVHLSLDQADEKTVPASTFVAAEPREWKETRDCFTYGEAGCPTRGRGRGYTRGSRMVGGRGGYSGYHKWQTTRGQGGYSGYT